MNIDVILNSLDFELIKELEGKTKKVYLVQKDGVKYILKIGFSDIEKVLIEKELKIYSLLGEQNFLMPKIIESGNVENCNFILQEFIDLKSLDDLEEEQFDLTESYINLAKALKLFQNITNEFAGEINSNNKFKTWKEYLIQRLNLYENNINNLYKAEISKLLFQNLKVQINDLEDPAKFSFLHMDLHPKNIFVTKENKVRFIDFDEAIFGDKDYELARIVNAHFTLENTKKYLFPFFKELESESYLNSKKSKIYSNIRTIHYIEILSKEKRWDEINDQIKEMDF